MKTTRYILMLLAFALAGCSDDSQPVAAPPAEKAPAGDKPVRDRVVITVNGRELHSTNLNEKVELFVKVGSLANPSMTLSDVGKLRRQVRGMLPKMFVREVVFDEFAQKEKLKVSKDLVEKAKNSLLSGFRGKRPTYESVRRKVGPHAGLLDEFVRVQATELAVRQHILEKNPLNLPANYAEEQIKRIKAYNAEMALTNAVVYARATNAWEKLKTGADFKEVARQFSDVPREAKEGGDWGTLGFQQLEPDEELASWAQKLQPGEFSPPIEGDNGLMILKVDSKKGDDYALSRVYFRLPMFQEVVGEEELVKKKRQQHEQAVLGKEIKALVDSAKVIKPKKKVKKLKKGKSSKNDVKAVDSAAGSRSEKVGGESSKKDAKVDLKGKNKNKKESKEGSKK